MKFISTRGVSVVENASQAIVKGLADDGGLFVPESFPNVSKDLSAMLDMDYAERSAFVLSKYLTEYDYEDLKNATKNAYAKFEENDAAPVVKIDDKLFILELFRGPTLAFKDIALTLLPYLLRKGADHVGVKEQILILVATSGDTGKAALEGFREQEGIKINVFYPSEGVSDMQKMQMATTSGANVNVVAVEGNFDDCQTAVKQIFSSEEYKKVLKENGVVLSSANSINFGRLAPQIAYYFSAYLDLVNAGEINLGDKVDFVVPTGNFGNILAGYYAKKMGLPVGKLICASNKNNVLTDFFVDGEYDINREFYKTTSPSMDILISSNLERLIFELSGRDGKVVAEKMKALKESGKYTISKEEISILSKEFFAGYCDEDTSATVTEEFFEEYAYVLDPHTSVAVAVLNDYGIKNNTVVLSTASPYKFPASVLDALNESGTGDPFKDANKLEEVSAMPIPESILELKTKPIRFTTVAKKDELFSKVLEFVKL